MNLEQIAITFYRQKNGTKGADITMHKSNDKKLCPVRPWGNITKRILSYPKTNENTPVNYVLLKNKPYYIILEDNSWM